MQGLEGVALILRRKNSLALEARLSHTWWERDTRGSCNQGQNCKQKILILERHLLKKGYRDKYLLAQRIKLFIETKRTNILVIKCSGSIRLLFRKISH